MRVDANLMIERFKVLRITNRKARAFLERLASGKLNIGSGRRPVRGLRAIEIHSPGGTELFVGFKVNQQEFREITYEPINDVISDVKTP